MRAFFFFLYEWYILALHEDARLASNEKRRCTGPVLYPALSERERQHDGAGLRERTGTRGSSPKADCTI